MTICNGTSKYPKVVPYIFRQLSFHIDGNPVRTTLVPNIENG